MSPPLWGDCGGREEDEPVISVYITGSQRATGRPGVDRECYDLNSQPTLWGHSSRDPRQGLARGRAPYDPHLGGKGATWARGAQCG